MVDFTQKYAGCHVEKHNCLAMFYDRKFPFCDVRCPVLGYTWRPTLCRKFGLLELPGIPLEITNQGSSLPTWTLPHSFCCRELIVGGGDGKSYRCWIPDSFKTSLFSKGWISEQVETRSKNMDFCALQWQPQGLSWLVRLPSTGSIVECAHKGVLVKGTSS